MLSKQTQPSFVALRNHPYSTSPVRTSSLTSLGFEKSLRWDTKGKTDSTQSCLLLQFVMIRGHSSPHKSVMTTMAFAFALASFAVACCAPGALGVETRLLRLGQELKREKLPFRGGDGKCLYELMDTKGAHWFIFKIFRHLPSFQLISYRSSSKIQLPQQENCSTRRKLSFTSPKNRLRRISKLGRNGGFWCLSSLKGLSPSHMWESRSSSFIIFF